jgi:putative membrane protein
MQKQMILATILAISLASSAAVSAKDVSKAGLTPADKKFMHDTAIGGMTEVKLGEVAEKHAANQKVKDFAAHMVADHTRADESLAKLATENGVTLPTDSDAKHKAVIARLSKLNGDKFDHDFMDQMLDDHKQVIADLKAEEKTTANGPLKEWCERTMSTVKEHLKMAETVDSIVDKR